MSEFSIESLPDVDPDDVRQWIPFSEARIIHEAHHGHCLELEDGYGGDPNRLIQSIWDAAEDHRDEGHPRCWVWKYRAAPRRST